VNGRRRDHEANNGTIQQFIFPAVAAPLQREAVESVRTLLANDLQTEVRLPKADMPAIRAFSEAEIEPAKEEIIENTTMIALMILQAANVSNLTFSYSYYHHGL
jgi:hypothetical protein